jgi:hypothetical protein
MSGGKGDRLSDEQLRELGVVFFNPPVQPIRKTVIADGRKCRVSGKQHFPGRPQHLTENKQVFRSEAERKKHIAACNLQVTSNCIQGAR